MGRKTLRLVTLDDVTVPPLAVLPPRPTSRRVLRRIDTSAMDLQASVRLGAHVAQGHLVNISVAGCCLHVKLPLITSLVPGAIVTVTLFTEEEPITCTGEIIGLDRADEGEEGVADSYAHLRLRFRSLAPQTHRSLLGWINTLVTRDFQIRYSSR